MTPQRMRRALIDPISTKPVLHDALWILDFYHASKNRMKAAKAIFGDDSNR